jgi:hypothetical protein
MTPRQKENWQKFQESVMSFEEFCKYEEAKAKIVTGQPLDDFAKAEQDYLERLAR